jgi:chemotaxis protein CheX
MPPRKPSSRAAAAVVDLPAILDIKAAAPLHQSILAVRGKALTLDASQVQRLGGQCLQILLATVFAWREDGKALAIGSPSRAFEEGLALLGFTVDSLMAKEAA